MTESKRPYFAVGVEDFSKLPDDIREELVAWVRTLDHKRITQVVSFPEGLHLTYFEQPYSVIGSECLKSTTFLPFKYLPIDLHLKLTSLIRNQHGIWRQPNP